MEKWPTESMERRTAGGSPDATHGELWTSRGGMKLVQKVHFDERRTTRGDYSGYGRAA